MPSKKKSAPDKSSNRKARATNSLKADVKAALSWLEENSSPKIRDEMLPRYGITAKKAFGVSVSNIQKLAKITGRNHKFAQALWDTGWYEARMLAAFVDEPERITPAQMESWCCDFDSWGICDTVCFHLFDRTPHAYRKVKPWTKRKEEFVKRGGLALMACLALHDKQANDEVFAKWLPVIEKAATDERNFVKKAVSWALRAVGGRSVELRVSVLTLAECLAQSSDSTARWVGKDVLRQLTRSKRGRAQS